MFVRETSVILVKNTHSASFAVPIDRYPAIGVSSLKLLMREKIPDTRQCETQLGICTRSNFGGNNGGCRKCGPRGIGNAREMLGFGSIAKENAKAHPVGHGA